MTVPARSPVDDALAVLRRGCYLGGELPTVEEVEAALATVREALERLREERDDKHGMMRAAIEDAEAAEAEERRLREGLREIESTLLAKSMDRVSVALAQARALLADSPDWANTEGGEA